MKPDTLGLTVLDEPCAKQSDPVVLDLQLRAISKQQTDKKLVGSCSISWPEISLPHPHCRGGDIIESQHRPPGKSVYCKAVFLIFHPKHMLWIQKRTVSMRRFF